MCRVRLVSVVVCALTVVTVVTGSERRDGRRRHPGRWLLGGGRRSQPRRSPESSDVGDDTEFVTQWLRDSPDNSTRLNLSSVGLSSLPPAPFIRFRNTLVSLDISNNSLQTLDKKWAALLNSMPSLQTLRLSGNPFTCSCQIAWLPEFLQRNAAMVPDRDLVECHQPVRRPLLRPWPLVVQHIGCFLELGLPRLEKQCPYDDKFPCLVRTQSGAVSTIQCHDKNKVCDGALDCPDGSDEDSLVCASFDALRQTGLRPDHGSPQGWIRPPGVGLHGNNGGGGGGRGSGSVNNNNNNNNGGRQPSILAGNNPADDPTDCASCYAPSVDFVEPHPWSLLVHWTPPPTSVYDFTTGNWSVMSQVVEGWRPQEKQTTNRNFHVGANANQLEIHELQADTQYIVRVGTVWLRQTTSTSLYVWSDDFPTKTSKEDGGGGEPNTGSSKEGPPQPDFLVIGLIAGGAGLVLVAAAVVVCCICRNRRRRPRSSRRARSSNWSKDSRSTLHTVSSVSSDRNPLAFSSHYPHRSSQASSNDSRKERHRDLPEYISHPQNIYAEVQDDAPPLPPPRPSDLMSDVTYGPNYEMRGGYVVAREPSYHPYEQPLSAPHLSVRQELYEPGGSDYLKIL